MNGQLIEGELMEKPVLLKGYFEMNEQQERISGPFTEENGQVIEFQPNGPYMFRLTDYSAE